MTDAAPAESTVTEEAPAGQTTEASNDVQATIAAMLGEDSSSAPTPADVSEPLSQPTIEPEGETDEPAREAGSDVAEGQAGEESDAADAAPADKPVEEHTKKDFQHFKDITREKKENRRLSQENEQLKTELKRFEEEKAKIAAQFDEYDKLIKGAKDNPDTLLNKAGLSYEELSERILNDGKPTAEHLVKRLEEKIAQLESGLSARDKAAQESAEQQKQQQLQQQIDNFVGGVKTSINENKELELTNHFGEAAVQQVVDTIAKVYEDTGKSLSTAEAATMVEQAYEEDIGNLLSVPKVKAVIEKKFGISLSGPNSTTKPTGANSTKNSESTTLTNDMARTTSVQDTSGESEEDMLDRLARQMVFNKIPE